MVAYSFVKRSPTATSNKIKKIASAIIEQANKLQQVDSMEKYVLQVLYSISIQLQWTSIRNIIELYQFYREKLKSTYKYITNLIRPLKRKQICEISYKVAGRLEMEPWILLVAFMVVGSILKCNEL